MWGMTSLPGLNPFRMDQPGRRSSTAKDKPYKCNIDGCGKGFYHNASLYTHQVQKHGRKKTRVGNDDFIRSLQQQVAQAREEEPVESGETSDQINPASIDAPSLDSVASDADQFLESLEHDDTNQLPDYLPK